MKLHFLMTDLAAVLPGSAVTSSGTPTEFSRTSFLSEAPETKQILPGAAEWAALGPDEGPAPGSVFASSGNRHEVLVTLHQDGRLRRWSCSGGSAPESPETLLTISDVTPTCFQIAPSQRGSPNAASAEDASVVVGMENGELRLYSHAGGGYEWVEDVRMQDAHTHAITSVCWSPDGSQFLSGGEDGKIRTWSVEPSSTDTRGPRHLRTKPHLGCL